VIVLSSHSAGDDLLSRLGSPTAEDADLPYLLSLVAQPDGEIGRPFVELYSSWPACLSRSTDVDDVVEALRRVLAAYPEVETDQPWLNARIVLDREGAILCEPRFFGNLAAFERRLRREGFEILPDHLVSLDGPVVNTTVGPQPVVGILTDPGTMLHRQLSLGGVIERLCSMSLVTRAAEDPAQLVETFRTLAESTDIRVRGISGDLASDTIEKFLIRFAPR